MDNSLPVITIDGPAGSGKGTIGHQLAQQLHWHFLDSGAVYRVLAFLSFQKKIAEDDISSLVSLANHMKIVFTHDSKILVDGQNVTSQIRTEECTARTSRISKNAKVRDALLAKLRYFQKSPGLVADGRDMGTVVFPSAQLKIFLMASAEERAKRRYLQLQEKTSNVSLERVLAELIERDKRDTERSVAPLVPAKDAWVLDTTALSIAKALEKINVEVQKRIFKGERF
jgi:cytidylate kinase